ncbi:MAG TPA: diguanylate cyclase [Actinomycetota bacterium]|nr:diguanylate cyclase [Actinomycetota bacterium]
MSTSISSSLVGRLAGFLLIGSGFFTAGYLFLPGPPMMDRLAVVGVCLAATAAGGLAVAAPWDRWPRTASLTLVPVALVLIAAGNYWGTIDYPYTFGVFYVVVFAWIGMGHPQWTALRFAPLGAAAYVVPLLLRPTAPGGAWSAALTIPVCVLVGEGLAWITDREERTRVRAQALARIGTALGAQMSEEGVFQTLVDEAREVMGSQHVILYRLEAEERRILEVYTSGVSDEMATGLQGLRGVELTHVPQFERLERGEDLVVADVAAADPASRQIAEHFRLRSFMISPIITRDGLLGTLFYADSSHAGRYGPDEVALARSIAAQAGVAIQNALLYQRTLEASLLDPLTELGNRRAFHERWSSETERASRHGRAVSLVLLDLDDFKQVNDAWGHQTGDRVLVRLAEHFRRNLRRGDAAFRLGGDEFALILPETPPAAAARLAERVRRSVAREALGGGKDLRLSISCGIASLPDHGAAADELFGRADAAMYAVKMAGGDAVAVTSVREDAYEGSVLGLDLPAIMRERQLVPLYQPIVELGTGGVIGYESFCRLHPDVGSAPTMTLFRAAGTMGLVPDLDRVCRSVSLAAVADIPPSCLLFLNVSPAVLEDPSFRVDELVGPVLEAGLTTRRVVIEVTEQERSPTSEMLARNLRLCREAGFEVALDDLGSGGADLELLARLPFTYVKVDMAFVHGATGDASRRRLLQGIRLLVGQTGARAIAEGVESPEDLQMVQSMGFWGAQGFLLGSPAPHFQLLALEG